MLLFKSLGFRHFLGYSSITLKTAYLLISFIHPVQSNGELWTINWSTDVYIMLNSYVVKLPTNLPLIIMISFSVLPQCSLNIDSEKL